MPNFAAARFATSQKVSKRRQQQAAKRKKRQDNIAKVMKQYDTNASGRLERDQVIKLLTDLEDGGKGNPPTDEELNFVLRRAGSADDNLEAAELIPALAAWTSYKENKPFIDAVMDKFDTDKSGSLDKAQLKEFLKSLNEGHDVTDEECKWVMEHADEKDGSPDGVISRTELCFVSSLWFSYVEEQKKKSSFCAVM